MPERKRLVLAAAASLSSAALLLMGSVSARAESLARDSDDLVCAHGPLNDGRTIEACERLRGEPEDANQIAAERRGGRLYWSDDYTCHHGAPGDGRTEAACANLRRDVPGEPGSVDPTALSWLGYAI